MSTPIKSLLCPCCGGRTRGRQWFNQDAGTGLCESCIEFCTPRVDDMARTYGIRGYHYDVDYRPAVKSLGEAYRAAIYARGVPVVIEIDQEIYCEALGCVPPVYGDNGHWWVGEYYDFDRQGRPTSLECWNDGDRYFCRLSAVTR